MALLHASDLTVVLPGDAGYVSVLDRAELTLQAGEIVDVDGPSGSGKTTLLRALARVLPGATGHLEFDGTPAEKIAPVSWRGLVALVPQKPTLIDATIRENLLLPWTLAARRKESGPVDEVLAEALGRLGVEAALDRPASRLSVGQTARVAFLRTLLTQPRVLLLDEPDAALDEASAKALGEVTSEFVSRGGGVVRVRHRQRGSSGSRHVRMSAGRVLVGSGS